MRRRELLAGTGIVAAAALAGCLGSAQEATDNRQTGDSRRSIVVSKSGTAEAEPDLAVLDVGVEVTDETAQTVRDELATRSDALLDALLAFGIDEDDVTTSQYYIRERIDERRMREEDVEPESREEAEDFVYYQGVHAFRVEVHEVDDAGAVVDTAVDAGASRIGRIEFTLSDGRREELREQALEEAIQTASSEADFVADQVDATVVEVEMVDTSGGRVSPVHERVEYDVAADDAAPATEFQPGDVTVSASVTIKYTME